MPANDKSTSTTSGIKRRTSATHATSKKRSKKGTSKGKLSRSNGATPEHGVSKPDGWDTMNLYKSFLCTPPYLFSFLQTQTDMTVSSERFQLNDTIFVNSQEQEE